MNKEYISCFRRWNILAPLGFIMSLFGFMPCTGIIAVILCAVSMLFCRRGGKRGFRLALIGLMIGLLLCLSVLLILCRNGLPTPGSAAEFGAVAAALVLWGIVMGFTALYDRKRKQGELLRDLNAPAPKEETERKLPVPGSANTVKTTLPPVEENSLAFGYTQMKPLEELLGEKPPRDIPYDLCIARWLAQTMDSCGYTMRYTDIGGGSDEVGHTGAVAYGGYYRSSEGFIEHCYEHYRQDDSKAAAEYGSWFTGLNYHYINMAWDKDDVHIEAKLTSHITVCWEGSEKGERIARDLEEKMKK